MAKAKSDEPGPGLAWPADRIVRKNVASLVPYARNARLHSPKQVAQIAASIEQFGWTIPVLISEADEIIAGHGRIMAASLLKIDEVPCMVAVGWSEAQRRAYVIADNKLTLNADWDQALLSLELKDLRETGFDLSLTGFAESELDILLAMDDAPQPGLVPDDQAPALQVRAVSVRGDVWILGDHRVMCGDSTKTADVEQLVAGAAVDMCWTDPPYNVAYETAAGKIDNDDLSDGEFRTFLREAFSCAFAALRPGGSIYVAHADTEGLNFRGAFAEVGFKLSGCLVWVKPALVLGRSDYQWRHEPILYGWKPGAAHRWYGGRAKTTVFEAADEPFQLLADGSVAIELGGGGTLRISGADLHVERLIGSVIRVEKPRKSADHPTMKPVELVLDMLINSSRKGETVLDLFGGSGTTMIAAQKLGRAARLMEFDPHYCDVIVRRWQEFTGQLAVLETMAGPMVGYVAYPALSPFLAASPKSYPRLGLPLAPFGSQPSLPYAPDLGRKKYSREFHDVESASCVNTRDAKILIILSIIVLEERCRPRMKHCGESSSSLVPAAASAWQWQSGLLPQVIAWCSTIDISVTKLRRS